MDVDRGLGKGRVQCALQGLEYVGACARINITNRGSQDRQTGRQTDRQHGVVVVVVVFIIIIIMEGAQVLRPIWGGGGTDRFIISCSGGMGR